MAMRGSTERLVIIISALVMIIGMPAVIIAAIALGYIPLSKAMSTHPLVIIPYALEKIGWGLIWVIVAVNWVVHGSHGMRRILGEIIKSENGRKILDIVINAIMVITAIMLFYTLVFVP
ncbi:succinate dehydrogenase [Pyrobaculum sp. 3827-6]|uniref:succinate dehydrogenase n=1 Tax=Pyrobaculum sp. 3827-6 TaxID=2983604 RepID=UPI0021DB7DD2|nr:succinate dehydrogenase [Pyrobaculum sp. 3827-6]MCU7788165.1 succinate dehydrogenase [Pyrobaculum sp. 3827-6]